MSKKKVLVTGANGYIGRHVVSYLLDEGVDVIASDYIFDAVDPRASRCLTPLFGGAEDIYRQTGQPDVCIHLAWRDGFVHNSDSHIEDLPKHYTFLKNMLLGGLPQLVVMGSMHEVGYWEGAITEDTPTNPMSMYAIAKNSLRQMTQLIAKQQGACFQWIRGYYIIGDDIHSNSIFSKIVKAEQAGQEEFPFTSGKNLYDFQTLDELVEGICAVALQTKVTGIINCCSGVPVSLAEKVEGFIKDHGYKIRLKYGAFPDRAYDSPGVWGDPTKIQQIFSERNNG